MYQLNTDNGYIVSIVKNAENGNITEEKYNEIEEVIKNRPNEPNGYCYKLKTDLTWELCKLPEPTYIADE